MIKAHTSRRLYMREISIVTPDRQPQLSAAERSYSNKPVALIDPPTSTILMNDAVAQLRALRHFTTYRQDNRKNPLILQKDREGFQPINGYMGPAENSRAEVEGDKYIERRARIDESQRQVAEVNISHDGDVAVAVCMALDQSLPEKKLERIIDDGSSPPMHEPQWGDEGWLSTDQMLQTVSEGKASNDSAE